MTIQDKIAHVNDLAKGFKIHLATRAQLRLLALAFGHDELWQASKHSRGTSLPKLRTIFTEPVTDDATYAITLHEMGHIVAPNGHLYQEKDRATSEAQWMRLTIIEEEAAWAWARYQALEWTPAMDEAKRTALDSYQRGLERAMARDPRVVDWAA